MFEKSKDYVRSSAEDKREPQLQPQSAANLDFEGAPRTTFSSGRYMKGLRLWVTILALALGTLLVAIDNTVIAVAIPKISSVFNSLSQVGWYVHFGENPSCSVANLGYMQFFLCISG